MVGSASKSAAKKRGGADSDSTVSITIDDDPRTRKPLSDAKLSQLEAARTKALASAPAWIMIRARERLGTEQEKSDRVTAASTLPGTSDLHGGGDGTDGGRDR